MSQHTVPLLNFPRPGGAHGHARSSSLAQSTLLQDPAQTGLLLAPSLQLTPAPLASPLHGLDSPVETGVSLETLAASYPCVAQLLQQRNELSQQVVRATNQFQHLYDETVHLRAEIQALEKVSVIS